MTAKEWFSDFARGTALGTGIMPGVSGGTVGIIVNIYDKMIDGIDGLRSKKTFWPSLFSLIPIGVGCVLSTLLLMLFWSKLAYERFPFIVVAALAGFVLGALPILWKPLKNGTFDWRDALRIAIGFVVPASIGIVAYLAAAGHLPFDLDFVEEVENPFDAPWILVVLFFAGFISAVSCLVPGISGAMILFVMGLYNPILGIFFSRPGHPSIFSDTSRFGGGVLIVATLFVGIIIGFLAISRLMRFLLDKHTRGTYGVVIGFVLGSVGSMFINNDMYSVYHGDPKLMAPWQIVVGILTFLVFLAGTIFLVIRSQKRAIAQTAENEEKPAETE